MISCQSPTTHENAGIDTKTLEVAQKSEVILLSQNQLNEKLKDSQIQLIDVRTKDEVELGKIPGAEHFDFLDQPAFQSNVQSLVKSRPVIVYCASGGRSQKAALWLSENGFAEIYNLEGGYNGWNTGR